MRVCVCIYNFFSIPRKHGKFEGNLQLSAKLLMMYDDDYGRATLKVMKAPAKSLSMRNNNVNTYELHPQGFGSGSSQAHTRIQIMQNVDSF